VHTFFLGRSVAQTAAEIGIPEGTVKSRAFYALRSLRAALEERGVTA
jgi:RNA polymerase sigma-70 factor, ECF subfamily